MFYQIVKSKVRGQKDFDDLEILIKNKLYLLLFQDFILNV